MAESSNTLRMISLLFLLFGAHSEYSLPSKALGNASFKCKMDASDSYWKLQCESGNFKSGSQFLVVKLRGLFNGTDSVDFNELLNTSSIMESALYSCNVLLRNVILTDPSFVEGQCTNFSNHLKQVSDILNESDITNVSITHTSSLGFMLNILQKSDRLTEVRISKSSLEIVTAFPFHSNNSIISLILNQNNIQQISNDTFKNLPYLRTLDLSENRLTNINKTSFNGLQNISNLDLSFNLIETISNDAFSNMMFLENIFLQNNNLTHIEKNIFVRNKLLKIIYLSNNDLKILPPKIFHNLPELTNVSLTNCSLLALDKYLFVYNPQLLYVTLDHNNIQIIPEDVFKNQESLVYLNLGFNKIKHLSKEILQRHSYLRILNLTQNEIQSLKKETFDGAPGIYSLDLSGNMLEILTDEHIKSFLDLEYFDLTNNRITTVELGINTDVLIRRLFLSNNLISNLNIRWKNMKYLESIIADNNLLASLELPPCIPNIKQTITFSFKTNKISRLNLNSLISEEVKVKGDRNMMMGCYFNGLAKNFVDLTDNPLICDCYLYPFYNYIKGNFSKKYQLASFLNTGNLSCAGPPRLADQRIMQLEEDIFSCQFTDDCPQPCTCGIRGKDNMTFVNCSGNDLYSIPTTIPEGTTVLYFNNNKLSFMNNLNDKAWRNLIELHLDTNYLTSLDGWIYPESLQYLSVRRNELKTLPSSLMNFIINQTSFHLYLGSNYQNCTCDLQDLKIFLIEQKKFINDLNDVVCEITNNQATAYLPLISVPDSELCPRNSNELNYIQKTIFISLCLFFTLLIIVLLIYYKQRQLILSFFYIHCDILFRLCYSEEEYDDDKIFDAFVAYSSSDRSIVMDLLDELETHPPYFSLCIHERNWLPGRFICDNILSSVQSCKRIIILLSESFISSRWFNLELRAAVSKMSKEKISRIIVILVEKTVSLSNVDPELRHVISKRTYLVWKERWFWEKLRYAMPRKRRVLEDRETVMCQSNRRTGEMLLIPEIV